MEPERRRRRPAVSCVLCRRRKIRCNRETPCSNCTKSKNATCVYRDPPRAPRPPPPSERRQGAFGDTSQTADVGLAVAGGAAPLTPSSGIQSTTPTAPSHHHPSRPASTAPANSIAESTLDTRSPGHHVPPGRSRTAPEHAVSSAPSTANTPVSTFTRNSRVETKTLHLSGDFYFHTEHKLACQPQAVTRSVSHKTRMFGQSHWVNSIGLLNDMFDVLERYVRDDSSGVFQLEKRCKALARIIKSRRAPPWPCLPTPEGTPELPARVVADSLVECYFNTSETLLRVLHIPSFRRAYEAVWDPDHNPDPAFLVQLKLVMAMGATTYDAGFSLRPSAVRWLYEAQTWLSTPEFKHRLTLASLQANILLLIAREAAGVGEDLCWIAVGSTLRIAMYMGLHRDPASMGPVTTPLVAEMRRRLWNTVLEIALQSSINSGGPPLISLDEFDTEPPSNYDDDQLTGVQGDMPLPKPDDHFSQTTIAISLRSMFPQRLAIVKYLNNLSSRSSYAETLKLDADLREAFKNLTRTLQACKTPPLRDPARGQGPSDLELRSLDILLRRYYIALHSPFFAPALKEAEFAFSRRVVVESAIRLWRAAFPTPLACSPDDDAGDDRSDPLARLATSGTGQFRGVVIQGFIAIAAELNALLKEEGLGLGPGPAEVRPDLLMALRDYKVWCWRAVESGETNTKGYMMACLVYAQVEAARRGLGEEEAAMVVIKEAEEAEGRALVFLQETERRGRQPQGEGVVGAGSDGVAGSLVATPDLGVEDWDYMMSDALFDSAGADISWVFQ